MGPLDNLQIPWPAFGLEPPSARQRLNGVLLASSFVYCAKVVLGILLRNPLPSLIYVA